MLVFSGLQLATVFLVPLRKPLMVDLTFLTVKRVHLWWTCCFLHEQKYQTHFSDYIKAGVGPDNIEELYKKVHAAIRADPNPKKTEKQPPKEHKRYNLKKLTYDERKQKLIERLNALNAATGANDDDEDEDDEYNLKNQLS
ncbi:hypothetical protein L2E82_08303 [Cichorium intybus]|uniref:Uncharacterized protein n=1 Tax=Cichorium intybus TaxID=13427 RepID=A0ACB9G5K5_CICIN|nr:hypothetical protein L2E82_08303 [Cichorium intybus]